MSLVQFERQAPPTQLYGEQGAEPLSMQLPSPSQVLAKTAFVPEQEAEAQVVPDA